MKSIANTTGFRTANSVLILLAMALSASVATGQPAFFVEDFAAEPLDPAWTQGGNNPTGHIGIVAGTYQVTADQGGSGNVKLSRSTPGTLSTYTHEIEVVLDPFLLSGSGGTKTDFKWKTFGADGFMEVVFNSFGDMRLFHNDFSGGAGNIQPNTNIGYTDGDLLKLTTTYDAGTDTIDVTYSLNGGPAVNFYSGGGIDGPIDDLITNFVEVELFKFNDDPTTQAVAAIGNWSLIPEPTAAALWGLGSLLLIGCSRKRCRGNLR